MAALGHLSTEDLITQLIRFGIQVTEEEQNKFKGKLCEFLISVCGVDVRVNFTVGASQIHTVLCHLASSNIT